MIPYLFMGSPEFAATILESLCEKLYPPVAVVTQEAKAAGRGQKLAVTAVEEFARSQDLNVISTLDVNAPATLGALKAFDPELILVAAFGQLFKQELLSLPKRYCLNVHGSLLPKYRGAAPVQWAIWNGEKITGISIQKMVKALDAGDTLIQKQLTIGSEETAEMLMKRLAVLGGECLSEAVQKIEKNQEVFKAQDPGLATYAPKIERSHAVIDWKKGASRIYNQIRALQPWPIAETRLGPARLKIFAANVEEKKASGPPGQILTNSKDRLAVVCGDSQALSLTEIQLENRKRLNIQEFLTAYRGSFPHQKMGTG